MRQLGNIDGSGSAYNDKPGIPLPVQQKADLAIERCGEQGQFTRLFRIINAVDWEAAAIEALQRVDAGARQTLQVACGRGNGLLQRSQPGGDQCIVARY